MQDTLNDVESLYNGSTGRLIAGRVKNQIFIGDEPNPEKAEVRRFLDQNYAKVHLRLLADQDWAATGAKILKCDCPYLEDDKHRLGCAKHPATEFSANIDYRNGTQMVQPASGGDLSRFAKQ